MQFAVDVSMGTPLIEDKRWSIDLEKRIQEEHYSDSKLYNHRYAFNPKSGKEIFVVDTPPPYPSGTWHIGAVAQYSMIDVIARSQRLLGKEVFFPWGVDKHCKFRHFSIRFHFHFPRPGSSRPGRPPWGV